MLSEVTFTADERASGVPRPEHITAGLKALHLEGCVLLRDVFAPDYIEALRQEYVSRHGEQLRAPHHPGAGEVNPKRFLHPLEISGPFAAPDFYANPLVLPILRRALGDDLVLGVYSAVTSFPGAEIQHLHRDGQPLFNIALNRLAPPHAVNFFVPLIEFNELTGGTRYYPGTHTDAGPDSADRPFVDPVVPVGSCVLMDYRLYHHGLPNRSTQPRPLIVTVYQKPWFKDYRNHDTLPFLRISDENYARIPAAHRRLFSWTEHYRNGLY